MIAKKRQQVVEAFNVTTYQQTHNCYNSMLSILFDNINDLLLIGIAMNDRYFEQYITQQCYIYRQYDIVL